MAAAPGEVRWQACLGPEARFRRLDAEVLIFNPQRGETQLLTFLSAATLEELRRAPATADELAAHVAPLVPSETPPAQILQRVREILDELHRVGLAQPCNGASRSPW